MKKILLIFADSAIKNGLVDADELRALLQQEAEQTSQDTQIFITYARSLSYFVSNERSVIYDHRNRMLLEDYDLVYFRRVGTIMQQMLSCAVYLQEHGVPFFDQEIASTSSRNKLSQMFKLQAAGVSIPTTFFCRHKARMLRLIRTKFRDELQFPLIAKATAGTRGAANYLVHNLEELEALITKSRRHFLIQSFVPNNGDYRVLMMSGKVTGIVERTAVEGSHLNNTSQGGSAQWLEATALSPEILQQAAHAALIFKRDIAGVDIILNRETGAHYVLEVNRAPQIEHASFPEKKAAALLHAMNRRMQDFVPEKATVVSNDAEKKIIGRFETVTLPDELEFVAKVDTGADTSSVHCERIEQTTTADGTPMLRYSFQKSGEKWHETTQFSERVIRSSNGQATERYLVPLAIKIGAQEYAVNVTLSNRQAMAREILLGRRFLRDNKMVVDVARRFVLTRQKGKLNI